MFKPGNTIPKIGEIRFGYSDGDSKTHKYKGIHPYLVVSNNTYNKYSKQSEVIPFTTKRQNSENPVHVVYELGEVEGLDRQSTLVIEGRDTLPNNQLGDPIGRFTNENWEKAAKAMIRQCPFILKGIFGSDADIYDESKDKIENTEEEFQKL